MKLTGIEKTMVIAFVLCLTAAVLGFASCQMSLNSYKEHCEKAKKAFVACVEGGGTETLCVVKSEYNDCTWSL